MTTSGGDLRDPEDSALHAARFVAAIGFSLIGVGDFVFSLRVLPGDFNRDGRVNLSDFGTLRTNFNGIGKTVLQGDAIGDGRVTLADFGALRAGFNKTTPA